MAQAQFNPKLINLLKDILLRLHHGEPSESVHEDFYQHFKQVSAVEILLIVQDLMSDNHGITAEDVKKLFRIYSRLYGHSMDEWHVPESHHPDHPIQILKEENKTFQVILKRINNYMTLLEKDQQHLQEDTIEKLMEQMSLLGQFYNHYNRKEKLFFPILERYRHYTPGRIMWADDDRIRNLYKGTKKMIEKLPDILFKYVQKSYDAFESKFKKMIFQEESILLPIAMATFNKDDWLAVAEESDAFGYCFASTEEKRVHNRASFAVDAYENKEMDTAADVDASSEHLKFGGGYLMTKEANHIFNHLPMEITFVAKNGIFKYFNEKVKSSEMMFVRTPSSIGRNVAYCHPPKSFRKVMGLIRDLKTKRRSSESMWFKKHDQFIHITYKGVFDEEGECLGILEYVQDIQPFFDLPTKVKKEISKLDESIET